MGLFLMMDGGDKASDNSAEKDREFADEK
jgi:hypothetical protein